MKDSWGTPTRAYAPGIGTAVADRTVNRRKADGTLETWEDVSYRVALGNSLLRSEDQASEFHAMHHHLRQGSLLLSGRHLQHGDENQPNRPQEVFTNCSTAAASFMLFYLLLNGSGVGRAYDDDMMLVDWAQDMPELTLYIDPSHPDVASGEIHESFTVMPDRQNLIVYEVPDSREGWAKAVERVELLTYKKTYADRTLVLDFSKVRHRGQPIAGMQGRPASGPGTLMTALSKVGSVRGSGMAPWLATMHVDHHLAECVLVGGARRAARMATKTWRDGTVMDFIEVKRGGVLWSSNNSVTVDAEFWEGVQTPQKRGVVPMHAWAHMVAEKAIQAAYHDGTGEPGIITVSALTQKNEGLEALFDGDYARSARFQIDAETLDLTAALAKVFAKKPFTQITNPCGEISLGMLGGYCVIADVVPFHAGERWRYVWDDQALREWDDDVEDAFRTATRALLRVNLMDCLYGKEVKRTNRIGVGFTGIHEYAWARFKLGWKGLVDLNQSAEFWLLMSRFSNACVDEARKYSAELGTAMPHTITTVKPAGTTSKLFALTEGAHLPSMREYLRWVQFRHDDPLIEEYRDLGYPVKDLKTYTGTTIVGFPTVPAICTLGMDDKLVTAAEATPDEQYAWLTLLETYWIDGADAQGNRHDFGNQVSYTLKYKPDLVDFATFRQTFISGQSSIRCCSVMPQVDGSAYEYQPEQPVTREEFEAILAAIKVPAQGEDIGLEHVDCGSGGCPIDFSDHRKPQLADMWPTVDGGVDPSPAQEETTNTTA